MADYKNLAMRMHGLAVFRALLADDVVAALLDLFDGLEAEPPQRVSLYGAFAARLYEAGGNLGDALLRRVMDSENPAVKCRAAGGELPTPMQECLDAELGLFSELSALRAEELARAVAADVPLPLWPNTAHDFAAVYGQCLVEVHSRGYGVFASHYMFTLGAGGTLQPVHNPDPQRLSELTGYEREREQVVVNTKALLRGLPANNILLYGDAGTGKSSTVKALANEYRGGGLRLVEVRKNQLYEIPALMDKLADNPLKFILFIDDLSFPADDGDFTELKAILEGNVSARPGNIVVYATSNRRHMVKEKHGDRLGDDVHLGDTLEESASLAARFGLTVTFLRPDRELYAQIVRNLAAEYGLQTPAEDLVAKAEAHAIRYGGRSPRTARQFAEYMKATEAEDGAK